VARPDLAHPGESDLTQVSDLGSIACRFLFRHRAYEQCLHGLPEEAISSGETIGFEVNLSDFASMGMTRTKADS